MFARIAKILLGFLLTISGFAIDYIYITTIDKGANPILLPISFLLVGIGIFVLMRAGKTDSIISLRTQEPQKEDTTAEPTTNLTWLETTLQRNNEMTSEWQKRNSMRDKMKMVELAAEAKQNPQM
jgi:hypothetical protein